MPRTSNPVQRWLLASATAGLFVGVLVAVSPSYAAELLARQPLNTYSANVQFNRVPSPYINPQPLPPGDAGSLYTVTLPH